MGLLQMAENKKLVSSLGSKKKKTHFYGGFDPTSVDKKSPHLILGKHLGVSKK